MRVLFAVKPGVRGSLAGVFYPFRSPFSAALTPLVVTNSAGALCRKAGSPRLLSVIVLPVPPGFSVIVLPVALPYSRGCSSRSAAHSVRLLLPWL